MFHNINSSCYSFRFLPIYTRHSIINRVESWSGVLERSGVKFGGDFGVEFGVIYWSH